MLVFKRKQTFKLVVVDCLVLLSYLLADKSKVTWLTSSEGQWMACWQPVSPTLCIYNILIASIGSKH